MKRLDSRLMIVIALVLWTGLVFSQTTKPVFEVASVNPVKPLLKSSPWIMSSNRARTDRNIVNSGY